MECSLLQQNKDLDERIRDIKQRISLLKARLGYTSNSGQSDQQPVSSKTQNHLSLSPNSSQYSFLSNQLKREGHDPKSLEQQRRTAELDLIKAKLRGSK